VRPALPGQDLGAIDRRAALLVAVFMESARSGVGDRPIRSSLGKVVRFQRGSFLGLGHRLVERP
jgi:hypothetical protein